MIITNQTVINDLQAGILQPEELAKHLLNNFSAPQLAAELAKYIIDEKAKKPIVITKEQLMAHIRIQGFRWQDGELVPEGRGRYANRGLFERKDTTL